MSIRLALAGNPNSGKTDVQRPDRFDTIYGNWPGVTVEKKEGRQARRRDLITDLPGTYSAVSIYAFEEVITRIFW